MTAFRAAFQEDVGNVVTGVFLGEREGFWHLII